MARVSGAAYSLGTGLTKERDMKVVFEGKKTNKVSGIGETGCGCACHSSIGAIGNNKPATQVKW